MATPAWRAKVSTRRASSAVKPSAFSVRYRLPIVRPRTIDRDAEERVHLGMVRREPDRPRVGHEVVEPDRPVLADDEAEDPVALRRGADARPVRAADPARHELLDRAARVLDPEGRVARTGQGADPVHDDLQHPVDRQDSRHRPDRLVEGLEPGHRAGDLLAAPGGLEGMLDDAHDRLDRPARVVEPERAGRTAVAVRLDHERATPQGHRDDAGPQAPTGSPDQGSPAAADHGVGREARLDVDAAGPAPAGEGLEGVDEQATGPGGRDRPGLEAREPVEERRGIGRRRGRRGHRRRA